MQRDVVSEISSGIRQAWGTVKLLYKVVWPVWSEPVRKTSSGSQCFPLRWWPGLFFPHELGSMAFMLSIAPFVSAPAAMVNSSLCA
jgi:hypothetical protein